MKTLSFSSRKNLVVLIVGLVLTVLVYDIVFSSVWVEKEKEELYMESLPKNKPLKVGRILNVPYVPQKPWYCSEASASMVLQYFGYNLTQDQIHDAGYDRFENMLPIIQRYVQSHYASLNLEDLKKEVNKKKPVIIRVLIGNYLHTVVVVGYDEKYIYIHDPAVGPYLKTNPKVLLKIWRSTGFKAIIFN